MKVYVKISILFCMCVVLCLLGELAIRNFGVVNFPIYDVGGGVVYIPRANQADSFLNRNDWYFNDKSMPLARDWSPASGSNILLIGNSIVMGGDYYRQKDKLTPLIQNRLESDFTIWPVATGGWRQANEIGYLNSHPEIVTNADYFVWEYMSDGLSGAAPWTGEYVFPTRRPTCALCYIFRRYMLPWMFSKDDTFPAAGQLDKDSVANFRKTIERLKHASKTGHGGIIWLYPTKSELSSARDGKEWLPERSLINGIAKAFDLKIIDIAEKKEWTSNYYRSDGVHPTVEGNMILASILGEELAQELRQ